jgi:hypothetical protein
MDYSLAIPSIHLISPRLEMNAGPPDGRPAFCLSACLSSIRSAHHRLRGGRRSSAFTHHQYRGEDMIAPLLFM